MRARYGVSVVILKSDSLSDAVIAVPNVISWWIGQHYKGNQQYNVWNEDVVGAAPTGDQQFEWLSDQQFYCLQRSDLQYIRGLTVHRLLSPVSPPIPKIYHIHWWPYAINSHYMLSVQSCSLWLILNTLCNTLDIHPCRAEYILQNKKMYLSFLKTEMAR